MESGLEALPELDTGLLYSASIGTHENCVHKHGSAQQLCSWQPKMKQGRRPSSKPVQGAVVSSSHVPLPRAAAWLQLGQGRSWSVHCI